MAMRVFGSNPLCVANGWNRPIANREVGRVLPANYRKVPFSGPAKQLNEAATARYFGDLSGESREDRD